MEAFCVEFRTGETKVQEVARWETRSDGIDGIDQLRKGRTLWFRKAQRGYKQSQRIRVAILAILEVQNYLVGNFNAALHG